MISLRLVCSDLQKHLFNYFHMDVACLLVHKNACQALEDKTYTHKIQQVA